MMHSKSIMVYGIIAITIIVIIVAMYSTPLFRSPSNSKLVIQPTVQLLANSNASYIEQFKNQFCGLNSIPIPNSNNYVTEYKLPHTCEMPLGIAAVPPGEALT